MRRRVAVANPKVVEWLLVVTMRTEEESEIIAGLTRSWSKIWVFDRPIKMTRMWLLATGQENDIKLSHELEWSVCLNVLPPPTSSLPTSQLLLLHEHKLSQPPLLPLVNGVMFCAMSSTWWTIKTNKKFYNSLFYGGGFGKFCFWTQIEGGGLDYSKVVIDIFFSPAITIVQPQILKNWRHIWNFFVVCIVL